MAVLDIITYPNKILKLKAEPVEAVDDEVRKLMDDMLDTMYDSRGVGLAAPQVGASRRIIVVDVNINEGDEYPVLKLANPEMVESSGVEEEFEEGCLSVPEFTIKIKRPSCITVKALNYDGNEVTIKADGFLAVALQHEMDHLEGRLIIDRASTIKREFYRKRMKKQAARA